MREFHHPRAPLVVLAETSINSAQGPLLPAADYSAGIASHTVLDLQDSRLYQVSLVGALNLSAQLDLEMDADDAGFKQNRVHERRDRGGGGQWRCVHADGAPLL